MGNRDEPTINLPEPLPIEIPTSHPRSLGKRMGIAFLLMLFWWGLMGAATYFIVGGMLKQMAAADYAQSTGTVLSSTIETDHDQDGTTYSPKLVYSYTVNGQEYTGTRYAYSTGGSSDHSYAANIVSRYPEDKEVAVYYNPADASDAVLTRDVQNESYFLLLFLQPFWIVAIGGLGYLLAMPWIHSHEQAFFRSQSLQPGLAIPTWGVVTADYKGLRIRKRGRLSQALYGAMGTYGLLSFLAIFIIGFGFGFTQAEPEVVMWTFKACAIGAGLALLSGLAKPPKSRVMLDTDSRELLVQTRKRNERAGFADIREWFVSRVDYPGETKVNGRSWRYFVVFARTRDGQKIPVHAFRCSLGYQDEKSLLPLCGKVQQLFAEATRSDVKKTLEIERPDENHTPGSPGNTNASLGTMLRQSLRNPYGDLT